jgi:hypothetical protein
MNRFDPMIKGLEVFAVTTLVSLRATVAAIRVLQAYRLPVNELGGMKEERVRI